MINNDTRGIAEICSRDVYGTRIAALYTAYGDGFNGVDFRVQRIAGTPCAALSIVDGAATLCADDNADFEEISEYLRFVGFSSLMCDRQQRQRLQIGSPKSGFVVRINEKPDMPMLDCRTNDTGDFSYREVYGVLNACGFEIGSFSQWLSDISLRCRRGSAKVLAVYDEGKLVSTASALYITNGAVLLGAVGTLPQMRGKGFAGKAVLLLAREALAKGKRVELMCEEKRLSFYEQNGFFKVGEWCQ